MSVDPRLVEQRYQQDQQQRLRHLRQWQATGVLEIRSDKNNRRIRTEVQGQGHEKAKVTLFGFMQQVAGILLVDADKIQLVDPEKQQILVVPANASGLYHLIGVALEPDDLFASLLAQAAPLQGSDPEVAGGWLTRQGETVVLDPVRGVIRERHGHSAEGSHYRAVYLWPEEGEENPLPLPQQVSIELQPGNTRIQFQARRWQLPEQSFAAAQFAARELYPDFVVEYPLQAK
ncbi:MAG: hypothetical protein HQM06_01155 [Magnetococcales bacterium]|nr:hypothetical protein [Magnetococcales bacterium]